jgi:hypothetical protein
MPFLSVTEVSVEAFDAEMRLAFAYAVTAAPQSLEGTAGDPPIMPAAKEFPINIPTAREITTAMIMIPARIPLFSRIDEGADLSFLPI